MRKQVSGKWKHTTQSWKHSQLTFIDEKNCIKTVYWIDLVKPGVDAERVKHVLTRQKFSIFRIFKLTQTDGTWRIFTCEQQQNTISITTMKSSLQHFDLYCPNPPWQSEYDTEVNRKCWPENWGYTDIPIYQHRVPQYETARMERQMTLSWQ